MAGIYESSNPAANEPSLPPPATGGGGFIDNSEVKMTYQTPVEKLKDKAVPLLVVLNIGLVLFIFSGGAVGPAGPAGADGQNGAAGSAGAPGAPGPAAVSWSTHYSHCDAFTADDNFAIDDVQCATGSENNLTECQYSEYAHHLLPSDTRRFSPVHNML